MNMGFDLNTLKVVEPIKIAFCDIDGTITDGKYYIFGQNNTESSLITAKAYNTRDVFALCVLAKYIPVHLITSSDEMCDYLKFYNKFENITLHQAIKNKREYIDRMLVAHNMKWVEVVYIGDGFNDLECLNSSGYMAVPNDSCLNVIKGLSGDLDLNYYIYRSKFNGGNGAVEDIVFNLILKGKDK